MYSKKLNAVIGFHGCDQSISEKIFSANSGLTPSNNDYDWLGPGIYFWENSQDRAWEWARSHGKVKTPAVVGALIDLGNCFDLIDHHYISILKDSYESYLLLANAAGYNIPENIEYKSGDILKRHLDCAVIQYVHNDMQKSGQDPYDTVRGVFWEGKEIYPKSGFKEKNHIQISVLNPNCIKGYFRPRDIDIRYPKP